MWGNHYLLGVGSSSVDLVANRTIEKQLPRTWWPWAARLSKMKKTCWRLAVGALIPANVGCREPPSAFHTMKEKQNGHFLSLGEKSSSQNHHYLENYVDLKSCGWLLTFFLPLWRLCHSLAGMSSCLMFLWLWAPRWFSFCIVLALSSPPWGQPSSLQMVSPLDSECRLVNGFGCEGRTERSCLL